MKEDVDKFNNTLNNTKSQYKSQEIIIYIRDLNRKICKKQDSCQTWIKWVYSINNQHLD